MEIGKKKKRLAILRLRVRLGQCCLELHCGSCPKPLFQSEAKCEAIAMKMIFYSRGNKTEHFHKKSFALSLVLKARYFGTQK